MFLWANLDNERNSLFWNPNYKDSGENYNLDCVLPPRICLKVYLVIPSLQDNQLAKTLSFPLIFGEALCSFIFLDLQNDFFKTMYLTKPHLRTTAPESTVIIPVAIQRSSFVQPKDNLHFFCSVTGQLLLRKFRDKG